MNDHRYMTATSASELLSVTRRAADDVLASGLVSVVELVDPAAGSRIRPRLLGQMDDIDRLAGWPEVDAASCPPALNVRVRSAVDVAEPDRRFRGWAAHLSVDDRDLGCGRWWRLTNVDQWLGAHLVASMGGFVVHVRKIVDVERDGGMVAFILATPEDEAREAFEEHRVSSVSGPVVRSI